MWAQELLSTKKSAPEAVKDHLPDWVDPSLDLEPLFWQVEEQQTLPQA